MLLILPIPRKLEGKHVFFYLIVPKPGKMSQAYWQVFFGRIVTFFELRCRIITQAHLYE